ncbi:MAG: rRNA-binding ribosome biosynthesis protein utp25, partial [Cyphobasidiales sp. Tagirdzhanova-0007]
MSAEDRAKVKLITLINVAGGRNVLKRKQGEDWHEIARQARKQRHKPDDGAGKLDGVAENGKHIANGKASQEAVAAEVDDEDAKADTDQMQADPFRKQYDADSKQLSAESLQGFKEGLWKTTKETNSLLGKLVKTSLETQEKAGEPIQNFLHPRLKAKLNDFIGRQGSPSLPTELLEIVGNYRDFLYARADFDVRDYLKAMVSLHAMSHINKTRQRIIKNNEALADKALTVERETRDQGFTRPKVLILLPFRNSALPWMHYLTHFSLATQVENNSRFQKDFNLPDRAIDKLAMDEKDAEGRSKYPKDHRETFKGNIDDTFRVGLKVTRKSIKLYTDFYHSDLIIASPLGLRASIETQKSADFLSSIEIIVADQLDVMQMQNWEHVQFIFNHLNKIPKEAHGVDFSRVKPWYLDGQAENLRQTILMSAYETAEIRNLFNRGSLNMAGRIKTELFYDGVLGSVKPGVRQTFVRFDASDIQTEDDARFTYFTTKTLPALLKSAVASSNTLIFVPSYFDFVRLHAHIKTLDRIDYAVLSEYSSNSDISRARTNFFTGKTSFLLVTERFHFFRRYKIRGARTIVFYAPPDHPDFYDEYLQYPFINGDRPKARDNNAEMETTEESLEAGEVSSQTVFSKYDYLKLERIVGTSDAKRMCSREEGDKFS